MKSILIMLAALIGAIVLVKCAKKKPKPKPQEENFSGLVDGASNIASSVVLLVFVIVGVIIVVGLVMLKKASDNPEKALDYAEKGARVYSNVKRA
jgi:preprotein translocase subunit SecG